MTVLTAVFTVLSVAFKAFVALSAVGGVTVTFEVVALAIGAGQGDGLSNGHENILTKPTTAKTHLTGGIAHGLLELKRKSLRAWMVAAFAG